jgi:hypothetical protein
MARCPAPLDNLGDEVSLSLNIYPYNTALHIQSSELLEFRSCFGDFQCARLSVPLDWNSTHLSPDTNITTAIVEKRAKVSMVDPRYGGMVMLHMVGRIPEL